MNNYRPRFNFFDVMWVGVVLASGIAAMAAVGPQSALITLTVFLLGCAVPVVISRALFRLIDRNRKNR